ncbi:MAG: hypothetical protein P4L50_19375 [Anaerolineaceae bacterium]|nr:hypothetical protein [Anaerolineaceae bacterium]
MTGQYFGEHFNTTDRINKIDMDTNSSVVNSDPFVDKVPQDMSLIHETPMGGTLAAVSPMNGPVAVEIPMYQTPLQEISMIGTVAAVRPLDETFVYQAPMVETIQYTASRGETIVGETQGSTSAPYKAPVAEQISNAAPVITGTGSSAALLDREESEHFRTRWNEIQGKFVDEPRSAVQQADALVSEVVGEITQMFAKEHSSLESQWNHGNDVSTEDLRKALQHYRSFFNRLVV